jgi:hypothetical protein
MNSICKIGDSSEKSTDSFRNVMDIRFNLKSAIIQRPLSFIVNFISETSIGTQWPEVAKEWET